VIAAAGIVALETMVDRLADDHENARLLAAGLANQKGFSLDAERVQTNIVMARVDDQQAMSARLREVGVLASLSGAGRLRFVTHYGIEREDIDEALSRVKRAMDGR
jgi:threonine aldolase